jgi:hypothetical protein
MYLNQRPDLLDAIPTIFIGQHVKTGNYSEQVNHYRVLRAPSKTPTHCPTPATAPTTPPSPTSGSNRSAELVQLVPAPSVARPVPVRTGGLETGAPNNGARTCDTLAIGADGIVHLAFRHDAMRAGDLTGAA